MPFVLETHHAGAEYATAYHRKKWPPVHAWLCPARHAKQTRLTPWYPTRYS